ncbi:MAG TPA: RNA-binding S4 domain-containing protein [Chitinophagaceae bacterium]|nr:RNA-binding S4 domain-containing protein [Chitinophagaceae bacterium]
MAEKEKLRLDKYLWAIRLFKTRSIAADACAGNKVKSKGVNMKAARIVKIGDQYEVKTEAKKWLIEVATLLHNRLQYSEAIKYYIDHIPEEEKIKVKETAFVFQTGKRQSKQGRPTKKQKRELDDFISPL